MKKVILVVSTLLAVFSSAPALALSTFIPVMECSHPYAGSTITVLVSQYEGPLTVGGAQPSTFDVEIFNNVVVQGQTQPQTQLEARFDGVQIAPFTPGSPETFQTQGLSLTVTAAIEPGTTGYLSQLNAVVNGTNVSIEVYCVRAQSNTGEQSPTPTPSAVL